MDNLAARDHRRSAAERGEFQTATSMVTLVEVLVHPIRSGRADLARLRAIHGLRTPDAIQLATAIRNGATSFLTNDLSLPIVPGLSILTLDTL